MPIIPDFLLALIKHHLEPLTTWFSTHLYDKLLAQADDELLVKLEQRFDFTPLEQACAAYHKQGGPGKPPTHTVPYLVRALFVKHLFNWSLRQTEFQVRFNLLVKWFVGYNAFALGPDHTTLQRFEEWVAAEQHRAFFDTALGQIDAAFPDDRQQPQMGDTFALHADAAKESLVRLIRHSCQCLLRALQAAHPAGYEQVMAALDQEALFGPENEVAAFHLSPAERQARLETTVIAACHCAGLVGAVVQEEAARPGTPDVTRWLVLLEKVLADEVEITRDESGTVVGVTRLRKKQRGDYRLGSATDPDATYRVHGEDTALGYNVNLAATENFVREIRADTGAQPDAVAIPDLLTAQDEHHDHLPETLIYDRAAGTGKTMGRVDEATDGRTRLVAPLIVYGKRSDQFGPQAFTLDEVGKTLTCPNGVTSHVAYRHGRGEGRTFRFFARQCAGCPLWDDCRKPDSDPAGMRQVYISDYQALYAQAKAYNKTDDFKVDMKLRPHVERIIAALVAHNGARRARYRGRRKSDFQMKMAGMAYNVKRWMRLLDERDRQNGQRRPAQGAVCLAGAS